jgi:hypothetical protein
MGAKAGIGVGAAIVGIAVIAGGILLLRRGQRREPSLPEYKHVPPQELGAVQETKRAELDSETRAQELP